MANYCVDTPEELARAAGLRHVSDGEPGIRRIRRGRGWSYKFDSGRSVRSRSQIERIDNLVIPPAWTEVWICSDALGHLQATGRDEKGRKQFLYHPRWTEAASEAKFQELMCFGDILPRIRRKVTACLQNCNPEREMTLALAIRLLDLTGMRIGHEEYVQQNGAYGLTTLRRRHLYINGSSAEFRFVGKSGQKQVIHVEHPQTLNALRAVLETGPGFLFTYEDGAEQRPITADDVNCYLREIAGRDITAKDFRTWLASSHAANELYKHREVQSARERKRTLVDVTKEIAQRLGNTPAVCRSSYLDPRVLQAYHDGRFPKIYSSFRYRKRKWLRREDQILRHAYRKCISD